MMSGDHAGLANAVAEAFDGAKLQIGGDRTGLAVQLETPGVYRPLDAAELSDGTLHYLALLAALRTLMPPEVLVFNEPETSLHPRVLAPLAKQIIEASRESQVIVVSHAAALVDAICKHRDAMRIELVKEAGATKVKGQRQVDEPMWKWTD
jgi:predicted ATPase